jgi:phenylacetate-CoA ligase
VRQWLTRKILLPLYEGGLHRRKTFRYWSQLDASQWLSRAEIERRQLDSLRALLAYAVENCPYYRSAWQGRGLDPKRLTSLDDFARWPLIDRETIQQNRQAMRSCEPGLRLMHKATGGSSGVPLQFDFDSASNDGRMAAWHRGYEWAGAAPGTRQLYLWGVALGQRTRSAIWKDRLYNALYRRLILNSFALSEKSAADYAAKLNRYRPDVIVAYTNPLYTFAQMLKERGIVPYAPRSIVVGAEKLHDFQRKLIEEVFRAPVYETYGSREFMLMGAECDRHEGLHLTSENLLVEVVDDNGAPTPPGEEGNVAVTDLQNRGMPFIRYLNGDRAIAGFETCSCGRGLPMLRKVVGRQLDVIVTPDGRRVPGEFFPHLIKDFAAVRQFQVVQETQGQVRVLVVLKQAWAAGERERLAGEVRNVLGESIQIEIEPVDTIALTKAGKLRVVVNRCAPAAGSALHAAPQPPEAVGA